jgi:hypothetical protein
MHPALDPRNLLTITMPLKDMVTDIAAALEIELGAAEAIVDTLTLTTENKAAHCGVPGDWVAPLFIEIGDRQLLRPLYGAFSNPFFFLLRELRRRYPADWDSAVNEREKVFRKEVYDLFPSDRFHRLDRTILVREHGKVITDIDAFVFDRHTKTAAVFQLKWQDFIGASLRKRRSQKSNLLHTGNLWVEQVSNWLSNVSHEDIASVVEINSDDMVNAIQFRLFVLGRNSAHFSGPESPDPRAVWGQWYQFVRIAVEEFDPENPIEGFYTTLRAKSPRSPLCQNGMDNSTQTISVECRE